MIILKDKKFKSIYIKNFLSMSSERKINNILKKLIHEYEITYNYDYYECPNCNSSKCIFYGTYKRNIGVYGNYYEIKIKRIKCKNCGSTHALIPQFIIPYYQNETIYMISIIIEKEINKEGINKIVKYTKNSRQSVTFLIKRYKKHLTRLLTTFNNDIKEILYIIMDIKDRIVYAEKNGIRFLQ